MPEVELASSFGTMGLNQYRLDVETFVDLARNAGGEPILMIEPRLATADSTEAEKARIYYDYVGLTHEGLVTAYETAERILREVAAKKQVLLIDATSDLHGRDELFVDPCPPAQGRGGRTRTDRGG